MSSNRNIFYLLLFTWLGTLQALAQNTSTPTLTRTITFTPTPTFSNPPCNWSVTGFAYLNPGTYNLCSLHIYSGGTLYIIGAVTLTLSGDVTIDSGGSIIGTGLGYVGCAQPDPYGLGEGPGKGWYGTPNENADAAGGGGGGHAGPGGGSTYEYNPPAGGLYYPSCCGGIGYDDSANPTQPGSGGACGQDLRQPNQVGFISIPGGNGGAALVLQALNGTVYFNGLMDFSGTDGASPSTLSYSDNGDNLTGAGGGAGGAVNIQANNLTGTGTVKANGGQGGNAGRNDDFDCPAGGGGSGGLVAFCVLGSNTFTGSVSVQGGAGGLQNDGIIQNGSTGIYTQSNLCNPSATHVTFTPTKTYTQAPCPYCTYTPTYTYTYTYGGSNDLATFQDPFMASKGQKVVYTYNNTHGLISIKDPTGHVQVRTDYDSQGRKIDSVDAFGNVIHYSYNLAANSEAVTDRTGQPIQYQYDNRGNILQQTDALGNVTKYTYDQYDNRTSELLPGNQSASTFIYHDIDPATGLLRNPRLLTQETIPNPNGSTQNLTTSYVYDAQGHVLTLTAPRGIQITNTYDSKGNLSMSQVTGFSPNSYSYDANGNQTLVTDPAGIMTQSTYDSAGNMLTQTTAAGSSAALVTTYTYDSNGNRLTEAKTSGAGMETTVYQYDLSNRLVETIYPDGTNSQTTYDSSGHMIGTQDQNSRQTSTFYNARGEAATIQYNFDNTSQITGYDADGRPVTGQSL